MDLTPQRRVPWSSIVFAISFALLIAAQFYTLRDAAPHKLAQRLLEVETLERSELERLVQA